MFFSRPVIFALLLAGSSLTTRPLHAQAVDTSDNGAFGLAVGLLSGTGLAYRQNWDNGMGAQLAGFLLDTSNFFTANIGLNAFYTLHRTKYVRFYIPAGVSAYRINYAQKPYKDWTSLFVGGGYGMAYGISKQIGVALELPLNVEIRMKDRPRYGGIYPIPSLALLYFF